MAVSTSREHILIERRYASLFSTISDASISALATALPEKLRDPLAKSLALPAGAFDDKTTVGVSIRAAMGSRMAHLDTGILLSEPCTEHCIDALGTTSDDPNLADLQGVIPELIEKFGLDAVRLMTVQYSLSLAGFKKLISTDERFALPVTAPTISPLRANDIDTAEQDAKRQARKARKEKENEARAKASAQRRAARNRV